MTMVDHPRVGTLPDFGNFRLSAWGVEPAEEYDRLRGMPADELLAAFEPFRDIFTREIRLEFDGQPVPLLDGDLVRV